MGLKVWTEATTLWQYRNVCIIIIIINIIMVSKWYKKLGPNRCLTQIIANGTQAPHGSTPLVFWLITSIDSTNLIHVEH